MTIDRSRLQPLVVPAIFTLVIGAFLVGLGIWQLERLAWKDAIVARIEGRTKAAPQPLPPPGTWDALKPDDYEYRRVTLAGRFENAKEAYILRASADGPVYHVLTPLALASGGGTVLVDRGSVSAERRDPATRAAGQPSGTVTVVGLMRPPEARNPFTPADEPGKDRFYTRDPAEIATHFELNDAAPFVVDADATPNPGGWPKGGDTVVEVPNNHFSYALTWFGLALGLFTVFVSYVWKRLTDPSQVANTSRDEVGGEAASPSSG